MSFSLLPQTNADMSPPSAAAWSKVSQSASLVYTRPESLTLKPSSSIIIIISELFSVLFLTSFVHRIYYKKHIMLRAKPGVYVRGI